MKIPVMLSVCITGVVCAIGGGLIGGTYAIMRVEASAAAWHWLDTSAVLANSNGSPKSAEEQRDSLNGNFVAQTQALAGGLNALKDDALRARVIARAKQLAANPDSIEETPLTLGQRKDASAVIACLASATDQESVLRCARA